MASTHMRTISAGDRRSAAGSVAASRITATRSGYERPSVRENGSPILSDDLANGQVYEEYERRNGSEPKVLERRRERHTVTTTDKTIHRSPIKGVGTAGNYRQTDRDRLTPTSPLAKRRSENIDRGKSVLNRSFL